jgi:hypothetical protein
MYIYSMMYSPKTIANWKGFAKFLKDIFHMHPAKDKDSLYDLLGLIKTSKNGSYLLPGEIGLIHQNLLKIS